MPIENYLELLDASSRQIRADKTGYTPADVAPIFERLKLDPACVKVRVHRADNDNWTHPEHTSRLPLGETLRFRPYHDLNYDRSRRP